jgi:hypothetical protein
MTMTYYIGTNYTEVGPLVYMNQMMTEANNKADRAWLQKAYDKVEEITVAQAYKWVRNDLPHTTGLYMDIDGKMRKAKE